MDATAVVIEKKLGELSLQIKRVPEPHLIEQLFLDRSDCSLTSMTTMTQKLCSQIDSQRNKSMLHRRSLMWPWVVSQEGPSLFDVGP
jgi:hypothetical protein